MKSLLTIMLFALTLTTNSFGQNKAEKAAIEAAAHWLTLVDAGDYPASWDEAAPLFKNAVSKDQWLKMLRATRTPLGKVISRTLKSAL